MTAQTQIVTRSLRSRARAAAALGHVIFTTSRYVEINLLGGSVEFRVEVEFFREFDGVEPSRDDPGEPAQYAVATVRAFRCRLDADGRETTVREYLDTPDWLEDLLADAIDVSRLGDIAEEASI